MEFVQNLNLNLCFFLLIESHYDYVMNYCVYCWVDEQIQQSLINIPLQISGN